MENKKILLALSEDFSREIYANFLKKEQFEVFEVKEKKDIIPAISENYPDIIILDVSLVEENDFEIVREINQNSSGGKSVILFSKIKEDGYREKAFELEVRDFILGSQTSPIEILNRIKAHSGEERSYNIRVDPAEKDAIELAHDLDYAEGILCKKCLTPLNLSLLRDLSKGKNYFKASFTCPKCLI